MKLYSAAGLLALAQVSYAFPPGALESLQADPELVEMFDKRTNSPLDAASKIFEPIPIFNKLTQYIDTSDKGKHPWKAPQGDDLRGPCPGLNAFANHGFIPRNGYATTGQFFAATTSVVGMGPLLSGFLAILGSTFDGDGSAWSIGGTPPASLGGKSAGNGISGSHNKYEGDASPSRPDLYQMGNDYKVVIEQFEDMIAQQPNDATANYNIDVLTRFRSKRFTQQVRSNPYFFNGPFSGVLVQPAAYTFIYRFMANHSHEFPEGRLNRNVLQSWFSVTGKRGSLKWTEGYERIPENWYRRPHLYPYEVDYFLADVANAAKVYPKFLDIGGNTGKPNTFTGVSLPDLSKGAIKNGKDLLKNNNFACLAYEFAAQGEPDVTGTTTGSLNKLINKSIAKIGCKHLYGLDQSQLEQFPGYKRSQNGETGA